MTCECKQAGWCPRFGRTMPERFWQYCQGTSGLPRETEEAYLELLTQPTEEPSGPVGQILSFIGAAWKHTISGMPAVTDEQYAKRIETCEACEACDKTDEHWKCRECGCNLKESKLLPGKARWASEDCPRSLWPRIELPVVVEAKPKCCGG